jgi:hypothetical protein
LGVDDRPQLLALGRCLHLTLRLVDASLVRGAADALHSPGVHRDLLLGRVVRVA